LRLPGTLKRIQKGKENNITNNQNQIYNAKSMGGGGGGVNNVSSFFLPHLPKTGNSTVLMFFDAEEHFFQSYYEI